MDIVPKPCLFIIGRYSMTEMEMCQGINIRQLCDEQYNGYYRKCCSFGKTDFTYPTVETCPPRKLKMAKRDIGQEIEVWFARIFSQRLPGAFVLGILSALIYVLFLRNSYASFVGLLLIDLIIIIRNAYYSFDRQSALFLGHLFNAICWFLIGALPFLVTKSTTLSVLFWVGLAIGLAICGLLVAVVGGSLM